MTNARYYLYPATQLVDEKLISTENPEGRVPGTWMLHSIPAEYIPNTSSTLNPGLMEIPKIILGNGKGIIYVIEINIDFAQ